MSRLVYIFTLFVFICACQQEPIPQQTIKTVACVAEPVIRQLDISLTDEQFKELLSATVPVLPETRSHFFTVNSQGDIDVFAQKGLAVICFGANWCGPCKMYYSIFRSYAVNCSHHNTYFGYCDMDDHSDIVSKYQVQVMPYTLFLRYNVIVASASGCLTTDSLNSFVQAYNAEN